jgi:uncharacterized protein YgiM (DUF1202 family)
VNRSTFIRLKFYGGSEPPWIFALLLIICLMGCQSQVSQAPPLPPPLPAPPPPAELPPPAGPTFYVSINELNLRTCPGIDCPKISTLELNTEVEKMGEIRNWTQIKVKKDGTMGYVSSRYLSLKPVEVAQHPKKKRKKTQAQKAVQPPEAPGEEEETGPKKEEPSPPKIRIM